ncbi:hypothetical protein C5Z25_03930 [Lactobacillus sp. CBA3605]|uniref:hypothetical protein n=1 Tax=Lactobacillus sp. CBA3605 TaxID=2099788 RepID=UPI000CFB96BC|nr:hypothetical protein [Lactobacillus sp. CBA3605]AVK60957.1 hypothetical protein C5Z25_03930 [Lactobacillus sp. CBA3605]
MQVDMRAYIFQMFTDIIILYAFSNRINNQQFSTGKKVMGYGLAPLILILNVQGDFSVYLLYMGLIYLINYQFHWVPRGVNLLLFAGDCIILASFIANAVSVPFVNFAVKQGWFFVIATQLVEVGVLTLIVRYLKKPINSLFSDQNFQVLLMILQLILLVIFYFFIQLANKVGVYDKFTFGTLIFAIIECLLLAGVFLNAYLRSKRRYQAKLEQQQLDNLRTYTKQLEQSQTKLRKFRHDYKNMLLSLSELT